jgi:hypothetical protein
LKDIDKIVERNIIPPIQALTFEGLIEEERESFKGNFWRMQKLIQYQRRGIRCRKINCPW